MKALVIALTLLALTCLLSTQQQSRHIWVDLSTDLTWQFSSGEDTTYGAAANYCSGAWRLPTIRELQQLHRDLPNARDRLMTHCSAWSSDRTSADGAKYYDFCAKTDAVGNIAAGLNLRALCVTDNPELYDRETGLTWIGSRAGDTTHAGALGYCTGWLRLPTASELRQLDVDVSDIRHKLMTHCSAWSSDRTSADGAKYYDFCAKTDAVGNIAAGLNLRAICVVGQGASAPTVAGGGGEGTSPIARPSGGATQQVCSDRRPPSGWAVITVFMNSSNCPSPLRGWTIQDMSGFPVGSEVVVCACGGVPAGWKAVGAVPSSNCGTGNQACGADAFKIRRE